MLKNIILTIVFLNTVFSSFSQFSDTWQSIDSLENIKQYEKALQLNEKLYTKAKRLNNIEEIYKSIIYQIKFKSILAQQTPDIIVFTKNQANKAETPLKNILHSLIVDLYLNFYQNNYRRIKENLCIENLPCENMKDWSIERLRHEIMLHISLSLSDKEKLQAIKISDLSSIIVQENIPENYQPNVYDFLAYKALDFLENKQWIPLINKDNKNTIPDSLFLLPAHELVNIRFSTKDTLSAQYLILKIYKDLAKEYLQSGNTNMLIYNDLHRFKSVNIKEENYLNSLKKIIKEYEKFSECSKFYYLLADYYYQKSRNNHKEQANRNWRSLALNICSETIKKYPNSLGTKQCAFLKSKILNASLNFTLNETITPKDSFTVNINYKNIDTLYVKITKINQEQLADLQDKYYGKNLYNKLLNDSKTIKIKTIYLPDANDYYSHNTKINLKSPTPGKYLIFISNNKKFTYQNNITAYTDFTVSRFSYITRKLSDGSAEFFVIDKKMGNPLKDVQIKIYSNEENFRTGIKNKLLILNTLTDKSGYFKIPANEKTTRKELFIELRKGKDVLISKQTVLLYPAKNENKENIKVHIITDKSSYLPGETIFYKIIVFKTKNKTTRLLPELKVPVIISTNQKICSEKINTSNEFGSFASEFKIPENLKTGILEIYTPYGSEYVTINRQSSFDRKLNAGYDKNFTKTHILKIDKSINNDTLTLTIQSKEKELNLLYELIDNDNRTSSQWIKITKQSNKVIIPLNGSSNVKVAVTTVKNNRLYTHTETIKGYCLNKNLNIDVENMITENISGSNVSWKIRVHDAQNMPVNSELLLYLNEDTSNTLKYNKLIHKICPQNNDLSWSYLNNKPQKANVLSQGFYKFSPIPYQYFAYLNLYGFQFPKQSYTKNYVENRTKFDNRIIENNTNIHQTAFFFPGLKTNENGEINLEINIPKYASKQRLNILAISKNLQLGYTSKILSIKKMLKIESLKAEFYRAGDLPLIKTKLINNTNDTLKGTVRLLLYQNGLKEILLKNENSQKKFIISPNQSVDIFWKINVPDNMSLLRYKIEAKTSQYIDIEQNNIKIINMRTNNTQIQNKYIRNKSTSDNNTLHNVNYTNNITINTLQLLDKLSNTLSKSSIDYFINFFTNSIELQYLKNEKNNRLKNLLLFSTMQNKNGSWSWFQDMPEDYEISSYIVTGFGRMQKLGLINIKKDIHLRRILLRSIYYLDKQTFEKYKQTNTKLPHKNNELLSYLYARSFFPEIQIPKQYKTTYEFYKNQLLENNKKLKPAEKLVLSIIAHRNNWQFSQNIENKIDKNTEKFTTQEYLTFYIEYLIEYKKNEDIIKKYISGLNISAGSSQKTLASTIYVLLLERNNQYPDFKLFTNKNPQIKTSKQLKIKKELFKINNGKFRKLTNNAIVSVGDTLSVKIIIKSKKTLKYLKINDNYAAGLVPLNFSEEVIHKNKLIYYQNQNVGKIKYYVYQINKGSNTIEYQAIVKHTGKYTDNGVSIRQVYSQSNSVSRSKKYTLNVSGN